MAARTKKPVHHVQMTEGKRVIIQQLLSEYEIHTAEDIQDALKDLLGGTLKEMMEAEMTDHLGYEKSQRTELNDDRLIFNQGHNVKELENKLHTDYGITVTPNLKERMKDMCNLSYGVDQRGYNREYDSGYNSGFNEGGTQRGEKCANDMFADNEPIDKIIRYSGLTSERVHEIGVAAAS